MSEENKTEAESSSAADDTAAGQQQGSTQNGPTFTESPDPLSGIKKGASDVMDSMEGKTVSMKTYVGTIVAIVVLMLLARCGG